MTHYALLEGGYVVGVVEQDAEPSRECVALTSWSGMPTQTGNKLVIVNGALQWVDARTTAQAWADVRAQREPLLAASDWMSIRAFDTGTPVPTAWATYRQALRDITAQADPFNVSWPTPPSQ
jgi:hypothetical protein